MDDDEATRLFERGLGVDEFDDLPVASRDFVRNATKLSSALYLTAAYSVTLEKFILLAITVGTTLFFLNYHYEGHLLAARMRFTIITTAALFRAFALGVFPCSRQLTNLASAYVSHH